MTRTKSADHILVAIMIALALYSAHSIFIDKFNSNALAPTTKAGEVLEFKNSVKRKTTQIFSWFDTFKGDSLYNGDSIFTYENSSADVLVFGNKVSLSENTLIRISDTKDQTIDLEKGSVDATTVEGEFLTLSIAGEKVRVGGNKAKIQISKTEQGKRITVKDGQAQLKIGDQTIKMDKQESINLVKSEAISQKPLSLNIYPLHKEKIYFTKQREIIFKFDTVEKKPFFEISQNFDFTNSRKFQVNSNQVKLTLNKESSYYWRICNYDIKEDQFCDISQFELIKAKTPNYYFSEDKERYFLGQEVTLNWEHERNNFEISILKDGKLLRTIKSDQKLQTIKPKEVGEYSFKITPVYPVKLSNDIIASTNTIKIVPIPKLTPVKLSLPKRNEKLIYYNEEDAKIFFKWDNPQRLNQFSLKLNDQLINTTKNFKTIPLKEGRYEWEVTPLIEESIFGPSSGISNFTIEIKKPSAKPEEGTVIELERPGDEVSFEWSGGDQKFLFEVSSDKGFNTIIHSEKTDNNWSKYSFAKKGIFYWRSKVINSQGKIIYSPPKKIIIQPGTMPEPIKLEQKKKIKIFRKTSNIFLKILNFIIPSAHANEIPQIKLEWPANKKAKKYIVKVYSDPDGNDEVLTKETSFPFINLQVNELTSVFYKVAIIDHWNRQTRFSNLSEVEIEYEYKSGRPIELVFPKHKTKFQKKKVVFEWKAVKFAKSYRLLISKDLSFENPIITQITSKTRKEVTPPYGKYYWKVISFDGKNNEINSSKRRLFSTAKKVRKKESTKKVARIRKVIKKTTRYNFKKHLPIVLYTPSKFTLEQTSSAHNVNIDGNFLNSISYEGRYQSQFAYGVSRSSGEVFDQFSFQLLDLHASYLSSYSQRFISNSYIILGAKAKSLKIFPLSGTSLTELSKTLFGANIGLQFGNYYLNNYEAKLSYVVGNYSAINGSLNYLLRKKYILGLSYESGSFEEGSSNIDYSNISLSLGSSF